MNYYITFEKLPSNLIFREQTNFKMKGSIEGEKMELKCNNHLHLKLNISGNYALFIHSKTSYISKKKKFLT